MGLLAACVGWWVSVGFQARLRRGVGNRRSWGRVGWVVGDDREGFPAADPATSASQEAALPYPNRSRMPRVSISTRHAPIRAVAARAAASSAAQACASWAGLCCHSGKEGGVVLVMRPGYRRTRTYDLGHSGVDQQRRVTETRPAADSAMLVGDHPQCPQWTKAGSFSCGRKGSRVVTVVGVDAHLATCAAPNRQHNVRNGQHGDRTANTPAGAAYTGSLSAWLPFRAVCWSLRSLRWPLPSHRSRDLEAMNVGFRPLDVPKPTFIPCQRQPS